MQCHPAHAHTRNQTPAHHYPQGIMIGNEVSHRWGVGIVEVYKSLTHRIGKRIGKVSPEELIQVVEGLNEIIGT